MGKIIALACVFSVATIPLVGCGGEKIKASKPTQESATLSVTDYEARLVEIKKRITFSEELLKEFPDLYEKLVRFNAPAKFDLLQQITALDKTDRIKYTYKYKDKVTNADIAHLIEEVFYDGGKGLTAYQKRAIIDVITWGAYSSPFDSAHYGTGWHSPIPEANQYIIKFLQEPDDFTAFCVEIVAGYYYGCVKEYAILMMPQTMVKEALPVLINLLTNKCRGIRWETVQKLGKCGVKKAIPEIAKILNDEEEQVRMSAMRSLGQLDARDTVPEIRKHLKDKRWGARIAAVEVLAQLGSKESVSDIIKLLKDNKAAVRWCTIESLTKLDARESIPEIRKLLQDKEDRRICLNAIKALVYFKDTESVDKIIKLLQDKDTYIRWNAIYALRDLGAAKEARSEIMKLLKDEDSQVRYAAIYTIKDLWVKQDVPEIIELLKDKDWFVRGMASLALKQLGDKETIPGLVELMKNQDETVRGFSAIILVELGAKDQVPKELMPDIKTILKWRDEYAQRARDALSLLEKEN